jgi:hypothetical protein
MYGSASKSKGENERNNSQVGLGGADKGGKLALVLALDILKREDGGCLLVDHGAETGLALDDDVGDAHLAAKSRKEDNQLDGVDVVSDDNERRLLCLNEGNAVVQTVLDVKRLLVLYIIVIKISVHNICVLDTNLSSLLFISGSFGKSLKTLLLLDLGLWAVLVEELEELGSSVLVESVRELGNGRGNLQALRKDNLLALKTDVFRPFDEASEISLGTNVLT